MNPKKLFERMASGAFNNVAFGDLTRLLEALGFRPMRIEGSHHIYAKDGVREQLNLQPDRNGQAKAYQVRQVQRLVEKYDLDLEVES